MTKAYIVTNEQQEREVLEKLERGGFTWWVDDYVTIGESNKRLISIIRYMSGAYDFEVEKPKKWVVRSKDSNDVGEHRYLRVTYTFSINHAEAVSDVYATKFDTKEEAESWANSHQEVVEVEE